MLGLQKPTFKCCHNVASQKEKKFRYQLSHEVDIQVKMNPKRKCSKEQINILMEHSSNGESLSLEQMGFGFATH